MTTTKSTQASARTSSFAFRCLLTCVVCLAFGFPQRTASAEDVYTWTDEEGGLHFSTEPQATNAVPAELPPIRKEDLVEKIQDLKNATPPTCEKHGGDDCSAGADADGSVVCLDGFRGSSVSFASRCSEARLDGDLLLQFQGDEIPVKMSQSTLRRLRREKLANIVVTVRNVSGVEAKAVEVAGVVSHTRVRALPAVGPSEVEPFGLADYTISFNPDAPPASAPELRTLRARIRCANCR
ncbi:MAG: DUF4124 domain-containing protein [Bdellovibrionales bacterium]|nr:DUF4124 domain-containing protein [Bdellovibrionales bacterium]